MARRRPRFARYHEKNPTTETYVIVGLGVAAIVGVGIFLYSKSSAAASAAGPTALPSGSGSSSLPVVQTGTPAAQTGGQVYDSNLGGSSDTMPGYAPYPGSDEALPPGVVQTSSGASGWLQPQT